jgi:hypothetical protein
VLVALLGGLGTSLAAVGSVIVKATMNPAAPSTEVAAGETRDGPLLPLAHPLHQHHKALAQQSGGQASAETLTLRRNCVWGKPGGNPYRGSVEQALRSAALPEAVVQDIARQVRDGTPVELLEIGTDGIRGLDSGRVFDARQIAMTFGMTLCLSTRVNFAPGHVEPAELYEARDTDGRTLAVMVPRVCGNVSVLNQADDGPELALKSGADADPEWRRMPAILYGQPWGGGRYTGGGHHVVSVPGTLSIALLGLGLMAGLRRLGRHGRC